MNIAILGGSFDPPHVGHYLIAQQVRDLLHMDQVWLMPAFQHPFQKKLSLTGHRLAMTKLLENETIKASDFEIKHNKTSYTIDTLKALEEQYPNDTFYWVTGSDQLESFQKYKDWRQIVAKHNLIIFPREWILPFFEDRVKEKLQLQSIPKNVIVLQNDELLLTNISSTGIRRRVQNSLPITYLVPAQVETYIQKKKLYK